MTIPTDAAVIRRKMDTSDQVPVIVAVDQGSDDDATLYDGETIVEHSVAVSAAAALLGLRIVTLAPRAPQRSGLVTVQWIEVEESKRQHEVFSGEGILLGFETTLLTSIGRTVQFTTGVRVKQN